jgi:hypothetical protein
LVDNEEVSDEDIADEVDTRRVKKSTSSAAKTINTQISTDTEKGIRVSDELYKKLTGWFAQIITLQTGVAHMPIVEKMLKNSETAKRFVWVPNDFRDGSLPKKEWFKNEKCVLDKTVAAGLLKAIESKKESDLKDFCKKYVEYVAKSRENGLKKLKENQPDFLDDMFEGFSVMCNSAVETMRLMVTNTPDDKVAEVVAVEVVKARKKKKTGKKADTKPKSEVDKEENPENFTRGKRGSKKVKPVETTEPTSTVKDTTKKETVA